MKRLVFTLFTFLIISSQGAFANFDFIDSYEIIPAVPKTGEPFKIRLKGQWPSACFSASMEAYANEGKIYLVIDITRYPGPCTQALVSWSHDFQIDGLAKGLYPIEYKSTSNDPDYVTDDWIHLGYVPVDLPVIKKYNVNWGGYLKMSGGITGDYVGTYEVTGSFIFVDTGDDGWLTAVDLRADDPLNRVDDIAEAFCLPEAAIYMENNSYSIPYENSTGGVNLKVTEYSEDTIVLSGNYNPPCCDKYAYQLDCYAEISDVSVCKTLKNSDVNKDGKINLQDLSIISKEYNYYTIQDLTELALNWLDCQLLDLENCIP